MIQGARAMGATVTDFGLLTTPQLHHIVRMANSTDPASVPWRSEEGYYAMLAAAYRDILQVEWHSSCDES